MTSKQTLLEELSTIIENEGSANNIIVPKTISKKYIEYILSINKIDNIKIFYMEEFVFYTNNIDGYNLIQEDKFFLEEILESTDSIFNKQNLYNETDYSSRKIEEVLPQYSDDSEEVDGRIVLRDNFDQMFSDIPEAMIFGEDVGKIGGVNQGVEGLQAKYGELRVSDTGIRETTIL